MPGALAAINRTFTECSMKIEKISILDTQSFKTLPVLICLLFSLNIQAQINPIGKTYTAQIGIACKEFNYGNCTLYTNCILSFEKDSVNISYTQNASCSNKEKETYYTKDNYNSKLYSWSIQNNKIQINGFSDYGILLIEKDALLGQIQKNKIEKLHFVIKDINKIKQD
jgi:hypothetical protein